MSETPHRVGVFMPSVHGIGALQAESNRST
jgi:hypothetical protein